MSRKKHRTKKRKKLIKKGGQLLTNHQVKSTKSSLNPLPFSLNKNKKENQEELLVPLTYPPEVLKKDLTKTIILTILIILLEISLYLYNQNHNLIDLFSRFGH